jgi:hypothetical protein
MENGQLHTKKFHQYPIGIAFANQKDKFVPHQNLQTRSADAREVTMEVTLEPGESYVVVPYTHQAGQQSPFVLTMYSSSPVDLYYMKNGKEQRAKQEQMEQIKGKPKVEGMKAASTKKHNDQYYEQMVNEDRKRQQKKTPNPVHHSKKAGRYGHVLNRLHNSAK